MKFCYYFLKEDRNIDLSELLAFFDSYEYIKMIRVEEERRIIYRNPLLDFEATFVISNRSIINNLHLLNPKYLDVNIRLEFDILLPTYKVGLLINIVSNLCKRFNFLVYNEFFEDVFAFRRNLLLLAFTNAINTYKDKYVEVVSTYGVVDQVVLDSICDFKINAPKINAFYEDYNIKCLEYVFLKPPGERKVYVTAKWDGQTPFILPPSISLIIIETKEGPKVFTCRDFCKRLGRLLRPGEDKLSSLLVGPPKNIKKIKKICQKDKLDRILISLDEIEFNKILDI